MTDFIVLYKGPYADMSEIPEDVFKEVMAAWGVWIENVGKALKEIGAPMVKGVSIVDDGSSGTVSDLTGYSIISAENIEEAKKLVKSHPHLSDGKGKYSIEVFELTPTPMDM